MSPFIRLTLTAAAVQLLASCGGGSADAPPQPSSGWVVDGYLAGATVLCDSNGNGLADPGEATTTTDGGGRYTFAAPGCDAALTAQGGTDADTGLAFKGWLKAPGGASVVTPLTTLQASGMGAERVIAALGLPAGTDLAHTDPALDPVLRRKSLAVAQLLLKTTELFAGLGGVTDAAALRSIYSEVTGAFAVLMQGGGTLLSGTGSTTTMDTTLVASLVKAAAQRVSSATGTDGAVKTALAGLNADALGAVTAGALKAQAEHILQSADGAIASSATSAQSDASITNFVVAQRAQLVSAPSEATTALAATLSDSVTAALNPPVAQAATLPISFDGATPLIFLGFNGAEGSTVEAGPSGGSGKALRILRVGGDVFAGAFITTTALPLAADHKTFTARVYSPKAGVRMVLKLEGAGGLSSAEFNPTETVVVGWQTLTWVATGVDLSKTYTQITLLPNLGVVDAAPGQAYFVDDIALVADAVTPPPPANPALPLNFDDAVPTDLGQFGAGAALSVANAPEGGSGKALSFTKSAGDTWAGFFFRTANMPFAAGSRSISARVYSPKAGAPMVMKLEGPGGAVTAETPAKPATVAGWQTLTWTFPDVDLSKAYNTIVILPDSGTAGSGQTYAVDDVKLVADPVVVVPPTNYLTLSADAVSLVNGSSRSDYTLGQFESDVGINVSWPIPSPTVMKLTLKEVGTLALPADLKVTAAVSVTETTAGGKGEIQAYIDQVSVKKTAAGLEIAVPTSAADALVYTVSSDGKKKAVIDFGGGVAGVKNTLTLAAGWTNSIVLGEVVQYAVNQISNDFSGLYALRGKYRVTVVFTGLPLRRADGTELPAQTVVVPTVLNNTGGVVASKTVTGIGVSGYLSLTD